jgi:hypothetical protein
MKAAAVWALLIAIVAGGWGTIELISNMNDRQQLVRRLGIYSSASDFAKIELYDAEERQDGFLILFAFSMMAASIALFAQAKHISAMNPTPKTAESGPVPPQGTREKMEARAGQ